MEPTVDLNADMGESFGPWVMGDDAALLDHRHIGQYRLRGACGRLGRDGRDHGQGGGEAMWGSGRIPDFPTSRALAAAG